MAKKQFIRHLEFYGFPDQNKYTSEFAGVDLSDIIAKNKEQDKEIQDLEGEKANKRDLVRLSGEVKTFISEQGRINQGFADCLSGMNSDITELKAIDEEFAEQLSAVTNAVNGVLAEVGDIDDRVDALEEAVSGINCTIDGMIPYVEKIPEIEDRVDTIEDVINGMLPTGETFASQEWVISQEYLTFESGDTRYAKIEDVEAVANDLNVFSGNVENKFSEVDNTIEELSANTFNAIEALDDKVDAFSAEVESTFDVIDEAISGINDSIEALDDKVDAFSGEVESAFNVIDEVISGINDSIDEINDNIEYISGVVSANTAEIVRLDEVKANSADVATEVARLDSKDAALTSLIQNNYNEFLDVKNALSAAVDTEKSDRISEDGRIEAKLDAEIARSTNADAAFTNDVNFISGAVDTINTNVDNLTTRVTELESDLAQEIADREQADDNLKAELIGATSDTRDYDTIWGAKKYADETGHEAEANAKDYVDSKLGDFQTELATFEDRVETELTTKATQADIQNAVELSENRLRNEINTAKAESSAYTDTKVGELSTSVETELNEVNRIINEVINPDLTILHGITSWDGTNPYSDSGNGVLDVLHREFHGFEDEAITSAEYVKSDAKIYFKNDNGDTLSEIDCNDFIADGMIEDVQVVASGDTTALVITWNTSAGSKITTIDIGDIFEADNYYTKLQIDAIEEGLQDEIDAEEIRAEAAESALTEAIAAEQTRAEGAESALTNAIADEETRAKAEEAKKVDRQINGTNGKALIFNETDGGGAKFEHNDGTHSFVGVNDAGNGGIAAQIYAKTNSNNTGSRLDISTNGMYYTVGNASSSDRMVPENEIAVKGDFNGYYTQEEVDALLAEKDIEIEEIQTAYDRLKDMVLDLYYATTYSIPADSTLDSMLKSKSGEAKLTEDITTSTIAASATAKNIVKLNLGGKTVTFTGSTTNNPAMMFRNKQQINIGGSGTIDAGGRIAVETYGADCVVTLSGTMFGRPTYTTERSGGELIYCYLGTINITDGIFKNTGEDKSFMLNCYDTNYKNGTAKIIVTGGKFYDFNPADNSAEGEHTSFVPEGYHVETSTDGESTVYTVKRD